MPPHLTSPHVPLGGGLAEGISILRATGLDVVEVNAKERSFRIDGPHFSAAVYADAELVKSVWYDDPAGRWAPSGKTKKIDSYLSRYGKLSNWELRMENGWMRYWFNPIDGAAMVYGVHMDVLRFNVYDGP